MLLMEDRRAVPLTYRAGEWTQASPRRIALVAGIAFLLVVVALALYWPLGVLVGLAVGVAATAVVGKAMHQAAQREDLADSLDLGGADDELRQELRRLRVRLGDDWASFARAAVVVTRTQWASVAGLQRELRVPTGQAQHLMRLLEREGFVGPARGSRRREVVLGADRSEELQQLLTL